jgi:signal transduction histidine kinase
MMLLEKLFEIGIFEDTHPRDARYIRYTNMISVMVVIANLLIATVLYGLYGITLRWQIVFGLAFLFGSVLFFSSIRRYSFGRLILSMLIPFGIMAISYVTKLRSPDLLTAYSFFDTRTVLLGVLVIPIVVFPLKNKLYLIIGTLLPGIFILLYNPIHNWLGVGYEQLLGAPQLGYQMSGVYYSVTYVFLVTGLLMFKFNNEMLVTKNLTLVENIKGSNEDLKIANDTIQQQSRGLMESNKELSLLVDQRTSELKKSNEELIKHNSELQQFSNTISHNLRAPVANLLGLTSVLDMEEDQQEKSDLIDHIRTSAESLDEVLKDLGKIIDIRNQLFQIKENVKFSEEFEKVRATLQPQIEACKATITTDFSYDALYCIRPYLGSILYNLLSNSLKYRRPSKPCNIKVMSQMTDGNIELSIEDDGIGIDLGKYGTKVFGMYKRFHEHIDGKGLGLFLTKQQVDALGGEITIDSSPHHGTKIIISCPRPDEDIISEQVFFESEVATVWFDAVSFTSTLVWKKKPTSDEYREALTQNLQIFRTYNCHACLADVRKLGFVSESDRTWFVQNILSDAPDLGMKKFIIVHNDTDGKDDAYFEEMRKAVEQHGIFFDHNSFNMEEAMHIIRDRQAT